VCTCLKKPEIKARGLPQLCSILFFETESLTESGAHPFGPITWLVSLRILQSVCVFLPLALQAHTLCAGGGGGGGRVYVLWGGSLQTPVLARGQSGSTRVTVGSNLFRHISAQHSFGETFPDDNSLNPVCAPKLKT